LVSNEEIPELEELFKHSKVSAEYGTLLREGFYLTGNVPEHLIGQINGKGMDLLVDDVNPLINLCFRSWIGPIKVHFVRAEVSGDGKAFAEIRLLVLQ